MRKVILTCGPRGAGKSTYCERFTKGHPGVILVSRDDILVELFGKTSLDPYTGGHHYALEKMWKIIKTHLDKDDVVIILDCWNGFPEERERITEKLRSLGADRIEAWYFVTPKRTVVEWLMKREKDDQRPNDFANDHELYHSFPVSIEQGFDAVTPIDPTELLLFEL